MKVFKCCYRKLNPLHIWQYLFYILCASIGNELIFIFTLEQDELSSRLSTASLSHGFQPKKLNISESLLPCLAFMLWHRMERANEML